MKKKVIKLDLEWNYIATYNGISHIKDIKNTCHISSCCRGNRNTTGGYHWMYYEDYLKLHSNEADIEIKQ